MLGREWPQSFQGTSWWAHDISENSFNTKSGFPSFERCRWAGISFVTVAFWAFYSEEASWFVLFVKENIVRTLLRIRLIWQTAGSPFQTMKSKAAKILPCFLPFFSSPFSPLLSPCSNHTLPFLRTGELAGCRLACWPQLALYHCKGMHEFSRRYVLSLSVLDTHYLLS